MRTLALAFTLLCCVDPKPDCEPEQGVYEAALASNDDADGLVITISVEADGAYVTELAFQDLERDVAVDALIIGTLERCSVLADVPDVLRSCSAFLTGHWEGGEGAGDWSANCRQAGDDGDLYDLQYGGTWATIP